MKKNSRSDVCVCVFFTIRKLIFSLLDEGKGGGWHRLPLQTRSCWIMDRRRPRNRCHLFFLPLTSIFWRPLLVHGDASQMFLLLADNESNFNSIPPLSGTCELTITQPLISPSSRTTISFVILPLPCLLTLNTQRFFLHFSIALFCCKRTENRRALQPNQLIRTDFEPAQLQMPIAAFTRGKSSHFFSALADDRCPNLNWYWYMEM